MKINILNKLNIVEMGLLFMIGSIISIAGLFAGFIIGRYVII